MRKTIAERNDGDKVWMFIPGLHTSKPLQVTVGNIESDSDTLMPQRRIEIKDREGMLCENSMMRAIIKNSNSIVFANQVTYDTEEEAMEEVNAYLERKRQEKEFQIERYTAIARDVMQETGKQLDASEQNAFIDGFVTASMYFQSKRYLLDVRTKNQI